MISIFVAKLDFGVDNDQLKALFEQHGTVNKATVALDRETRKSRGFGFVEMRDREEGLAAIEALDNSEVNGRSIAVKEAEDRGGAKKPGFTPRNNAPRQGRPPGASSTDRPAKKADGSFAPPRPSAPDSDTPSGSDDFGKNDFRKKDKEPKKKEKVKNHKMEAYKKSGKNNIFIDDEDEDEPLNLFDYGDEDEDFDSSYLINNDDEEDEDWDDEEEV